MNILHLTTHLNTGGVTNYVKTLAGEQLKSGEKVFVWASRGIVSDDLKALGVTVIDDVPRLKSELSPHLWLQLPHLIRFIKKNKIDIVHTHTRVAQVLAAASKLWTKVPFVSTIHMFYKRRLGRRLFPCLGNGIIAISDVIREYIVSEFKADNKNVVLKVVPNGMDVEAFIKKINELNREQIRSEYGYKKSDIVVLSLSRLIADKGVGLSIEAFFQAKSQIPNLKLLIVGAGKKEYVDNLKRQVEGLGVSQDVVFYGNEPDVQKAFRAADIFVAPYYRDAFGFTVLEAMAAELPIIANKSGGLPELLEEENNGLLFKEGDVVEFSEKIVRFAKDKVLREEKKTNARRASFKYTVKHQANEIKEVYKQVLL